METCAFVPLSILDYTGNASVPDFGGEHMAFYRRTSALPALVTRRFNWKNFASWTWLSLDQQRPWRTEFKAQLQSVFEKRSGTRVFSEGARNTR